MEKLSDAKKRLSMSEKYDFLTKNYLSPLRKVDFIFM